jgi:hypothetical protein
MEDEMVRFLRARLEEVEHEARMRYKSVAATRTLREIDAIRQVIDLHRSVELPTDMLDVCVTCEVTGADREFPCKTLRLLALPYTDHPDYRTEWRP